MIVDHYSMILLPFLSLASELVITISYFTAQNGFN